MESIRASFILLILNGLLHVLVESSSNPVLNLTLPINQLLQSRDHRLEELLRRYMAGHGAYMYSTSLTNVKLQPLLHNVTQMMREIAPSSRLLLQLNLDTDPSSLDVDAIEELALQFDSAGFVNWDNTHSGGGCCRDVGENVSNTLNTLNGLARRVYSNRLLMPHRLAFTSQDIGCNHLLNFIGDKNVDSLMLTIDFKVDEGNHHAQYIFDDYVSDTIEANEKFLSTGNLRGREMLYYGFRLLPSATRNVTDRDHILYHQFVEAWARKSNNNAAAAAAVILNTFNFSPATNPFLLRKMEEEERMSYPKNIIVPFVQPLEDLPVAALLCEAATKFDAVEVDSSTFFMPRLGDCFVAWEILISYYHNMKHACNTNTSERHTPLKLNVYHVSHNATIFSSNNPPSSNLTTTSSTGLTGTGTGLLPQTSVLLQHPKYSKTDSFRGCVIRFGNLPEPEDTSEYIHYYALVNQTIRRCTSSLLHQLFSYVVWEFDLFKRDLELRVNPKYYTSTIIPQLSTISSQMDLFAKRHPGTQLAIKLVLRHPGDFRGTCKVLHPKSREIFVVLIGWAYSANVTLFISSNSAVGFADALQMVGRYASSYTLVLRELMTKLPEFVSRNYPPNPNGFFPWYQDQCTTVVEPHRLSHPIHFGEYAGATLHLSLRGDSSSSPLNYREVQTLVQFSFHRFSRLEIVLGGAAEDGSTLATALSPAFLKFLEGDESKTVYICVPSAQDDIHLMANSIHSSFANVRNISLGGVHAHSSPEIGLMNRNIERLKEAAALLAIRGVRVGLFLDRCELFVAALFHSGSTSSSTQQAQLSPKIDYLVCSIPSDHPGYFYYRVPTADAHLYIARIMRKRFPNITMYFKYEPAKFEELTEQIYHLNISATFATLHKLKYFDANVASHSSQTAAYAGWWEIADYTDLADTKVYTDVEASFLLRDTWVPQGFQSKEHVLEETLLDKWSTYVIAGPIGAVLLITVISLAVWNCVLRRRNTFLSKQEVYEFRNGVPLEAGMELDLYSTLRYNSSYEISKGELNLDSATLLGMGNFGQVRQATVKGTLAAIKVPHDNCSKESFKSMLIEVKVMCHLGSHPNLVELIGCHTSEIGRGMIYIVTALCENGSLLACLKNKDAAVVQFQDMVKFAHEIACGMDYIAGKSVVHGDLATRDVLLDSHNICKIGDFGLSRKLYEYSMYVKQSQEPLPWRWMAYESLFKMEFTSMSDVWSYGATLWEIFSLGAVPYPGVQWSHDFVEQLKTGLRMNTPEFATPEIYDMMLKCWDLDPKARPTFQELVEFFIPFRDAKFGTSVFPVCRHWANVHLGKQNNCIALL